MNRLDRFFAALGICAEAFEPELHSNLPLTLCNSETNLVVANET